MSVLLNLPYYYDVCITQSHHIIAPSSINSTIRLACLARETRETGPRPVQRWEEEEATSILRPPPAQPQLLIWNVVYLCIDLLDSTNNPKSVGLMRLWGRNAPYDFFKIYNIWILPNFFLFLLLISFINGIFSFLCRQFIQETNDPQSELTTERTDKWVL